MPPATPIDLVAVFDDVLNGFPAGHDRPDPLAQHRLVLGMIGVGGQSLVIDEVGHQGEVSIPVLGGQIAAEPIRLDAGNSVGQRVQGGFDLADLGLTGARLPPEQDDVAEHSSVLASLAMAADWMLIDGSSLMFRAFFGQPTSIRSPRGEPVNAIRGFLDMAARLVGDRKPRRLVVTTDEDWRPAFRVAVLPSYKTHRLVRGAMPEELAPQEPVLWSVLRAIGVEVTGAKGFEAEDIVASLLPRIEGTVEIVTGDRDLFALIRDPDVCVLYTQQGIGRLQLVDEAEVTRRYGIPGRRYGEFAVLRGDPSDGLPGVPGVGEKTAAQLIRRYDSLDSLLESGRLSADAAAYVRKARTVAMPVATAPLAAPDGRLPTEPRDMAKLTELNERWGIAGSTDRLARALSSAVPSGSR